VVNDQETIICFRQEQKRFPFSKTGTMAHYISNTERLFPGDKAAKICS
jgi:hypothetical protein